jgi:hypothetical protein
MLEERFAFGRSVADFSVAKNEGHDRRGVARAARVGLISARIDLTEPGYGCTTMDF